MRKKLLIILASIIVISSSGTIYAETKKSISDLEKEQAEIKEQQDELRIKVDETQQQQNVALTELDRLDEELNTATSELIDVQEELAKTEGLLFQTENELNEAIILKDKQQEAFKKRTKYMYENGNTGYLRAVLEADDINNLFKRIEYVNIIVEYDSTLVDKLQETENLIVQKVKEIEQHKKNVEYLLEVSEFKKQSVENKVEEKRIYIETLNQTEEGYNQSIEILEGANSEVEKLIKEEEERQAELERLKKQSEMSNFNYTGGKFAWPVPGYGRTSSGYINRISPISGKREFHTGLDIPAPTGTPIVAGESGKVITAGWVNGFGYTVIISHGGGYTTLYGHNSRVTVSVGDTVARGQEIAKAGSTGYSTGPHCHFEVRVNGSPVNPISFLQ